MNVNSGEEHTCDAYDVCDGSSSSHPSVDYAKLWTHHLDLLWRSFYNGVLVLIACLSGWFYVVGNGTSLDVWSLILALSLLLVGGLGLLGQALIIERMGKNTGHFGDLANISCAKPREYFIPRFFQIVLRLPKKIPIRGWKMAIYITQMYVVLLGVLFIYTICLFFMRV